MPGVVAHRDRAGTFANARTISFCYISSGFRLTAVTGAGNPHTGSNIMSKVQNQLFDCACGGEHLTRREAEVLGLVAAGHSNGRIGRLLGISTRTVDQHLGTMLRRARVANRAELVARCYAAGILRQDCWPPIPSGRLCLAAGARA